MLSLSQTAEERTALSRQAYVEIGIEKVAELYGRALAVAKATGLASPTCICSGRAWLGRPPPAPMRATTISSRAELKIASGYHDWCELPADLDPATRAVQAFIKATQRYEVCQSIATQEAALGIRKQDPDEWLQSNDPTGRPGP